MEFIFEALAELIYQLVAEIVFEFGGESVKHLFRGRRSANPVFAAFGLILLGALAGFVSSWIFPRPLSRASRFPGISLILAPICTGVIMNAYGSWRRERGGDPTLLATFWGGATFAFVMAFTRWYIMRRGLSG
jgi:hypothetical protein